MDRSGWSIGLGLLLAGGLIASCSPTYSGAEVRTTRPVSKTTCPEATLTSGLQPLDRTLVPLGPQLLGVETTFGDDRWTLRIISGGYLDDILEAYDDLTQVGSADVRGTSATLLTTTFLRDPVQVAVWHEDTDPPCDTHAIVAVGMTRGEFARQLAAVT